MPRPGTLHPHPSAALAIVLTVGAMSPRSSAAAPDPTIASLLSLGSTLVPVGVSGALLFQRRGSDEGLRFDLGLTFLGMGAIGGPSVGQFYAGAGGDAVVTLLLRALTGAVLLVGTGLALRGDGGTQDAGEALAVLGGVPTVLLAAWDVIGAASSAREARYREGHGPATSIATPADIASLARCPGPVPCL